MPMLIAENSLTAVKPVAHALSPGLAFGLLCLYAVVALAAGGWALARRDAYDGGDNKVSWTTEHPAGGGHHPGCPAHPPEPSVSCCTAASAAWPGWPGSWSSWSARLRPDHLRVGPRHRGRPAADHRWPCGCPGGSARCTAACSGGCSATRSRRRRSSSRAPASSAASTGGCGTGPAWRGVWYSLIKLPVAAVQFYAVALTVFGLVDLSATRLTGCCSTTSHGRAGCPDGGAGTTAVRREYSASTAGWAPSSAALLGAACVVAAAWLARGINAARPAR